MLGFFTIKLQFFLLQLKSILSGNTLKLYKFPFLIILPPTKFRGSHLQWLLLYLSNGDHYSTYIIIIPPTLINWNSIVKRVPSLPFIYITMHLWIFNSTGCNPIVSLFILLLKLSQLWSSSLLHIVSCILRTHLYSFWSIFLLSGTTRCFRFILFFFCPSPGINYFSKESWFH